MRCTSLAEETSASITRHSSSTPSAGDTSAWGPHLNRLQPPYCTLTTLSAETVLKVVEGPAYHDTGVHETE